MPDLPTGTVTFLFTDIEGSTRLLKELGDDYGELLARHRRLVRDCFTRHAGREIDTQGDAFFYSFTRARDAVTAAVEAQRLTAAESWPRGVELRVRMGLHTGEPALGEEGYLGLDVVRAARLAATGRGGQILLSETTRALIGAEVPDGVAVRDLGTRQLKDLDQPEPVYELVVDGVSSVEPVSQANAMPDRRRGGDELKDRLRSAIEERVLSELERTGPGAVPPPPRPRPSRADASSPGDTLRWGLVGVTMLVVVIAALVGAIWLVAQLLG